MRKRNLSVHVPNSNLHAKHSTSSFMSAGASGSVPGPPSAGNSFGIAMLHSAGSQLPYTGAYPYSAGTAGYSAGTAGTAGLYSAGPGTAGLDSSTQDQGPLESARSVGSLGTFTPTGAVGLGSPVYALQWGQENEGKNSARGMPSPVTRGMSGLLGIGGGQASPVFRGMSGLDRGMSGLDRGLSGFQAGGFSGLGSAGPSMGLGGGGMPTRHSPRSPMMHRTNYAGGQPGYAGPPGSYAGQPGGYAGQPGGYAGQPLPCSPRDDGGYAGMPEGPPDAAGGGSSQSHDLPPDSLTPSGRMMSVDFNGLFA